MNNEPTAAVSDYLRLFRSKLATKFSHPCQTGVRLCVSGGQVNMRLRFGIVHQQQTEISLNLLHAFVALRLYASLTALHFRLSSAILLTNSGLYRK